MVSVPINVKPKTKRGGGLFGSILGGAASVLAAPFTGGASLSAAPTLMGAGQVVGEVASPGSGPTSKGPSNLELVAKIDPGVQLAQLVDARKAADRLPENQRSEVLPLIDPAIERLRRVRA